MDSNSTNIYEELWDIDLVNNGCTVSARKPDGNWLNPDADILLDEQKEFTGTDDAPNPLFHHVNIDKISLPTYQKLISLLDNYIINARLSEDLLGDNSVEEQEIDEFLQQIISTQVIQRALSYINQDLGFTLSESEFEQELKRLWFDIFTNHFGGNPVAFCSGFEHVFVGEGKTSGNGIGGYHSWIKFYLDEKNQRANFQGFNYDGNVNRTSDDGKDFPQVVTMSMDWKILDMNGNLQRTLRKDRGGFFVGPSPELQIAIPTVAYFENEKDVFSGTNQDIELKKALYTLVLYRSTREDQSRGQHIRSFFPKFRRPLQSTGELIIVHGEDDLNNGDIAISRALVNPEGSDIGKEWVELSNKTDQIINVTGWNILDRLDRFQTLEGFIEPNKEQKFMMTRHGDDSTQLGNKNGEIKVKDSQGNLIARVGYGKANSGEILHFVSSE